MIHAILTQQIPLRPVVYTPLLGTGAGTCQDIHSKYHSSSIFPLVHYFRCHIIVPNHMHVRGRCILH
jgi:hypothetical protein